MELNSNEWKAQDFKACPHWGETKAKTGISIRLLWNNFNVLLNNFNVLSTFIGDKISTFRLRALFSVRCRIVWMFLKTPTQKTLIAEWRNICCCWLLIRGLQSINYWNCRVHGVGGSCFNLPLFIQNIKKNKYKIKNELILPHICKIVSTFLTEVNC